MADRIRNYKVMKDEKLTRVLSELQNHGDAYYRCLQGGSGDVQRDIQVCELELSARGLTDSASANCPECGKPFIVKDHYLCEACA